MARKDFEEYYLKIKEQYFSTVNMLSKLGEEAGEKPIDPQIISNLEMVLAPVKNSYLQLAYIEYLLNLPKDKKIKARNKQQFEAQFSKLSEVAKPETILNNNLEAISRANDVIKEEFND